MTPQQDLHKDVVKPLVRTTEATSDVQETAPVKRRKCWLVREWWKEMLTWALGTLALLTIFVLLIDFNGKTLRKWRSRISLNTMVAVLAQVAASALLYSVSASIGQLKWTWLRKRRELADVETFDSASRGPDGSLQFLWLMRSFRNPAVLGAWITILVLAFPPFAQQSVKLDNSRWIMSDTIGSVPRASGYQPLGGTFPNGTVPWSIMNAVWTGLSRNDLTDSQVPGKCPSSNCTWEPYGNLALCSSTTDVTWGLAGSCSNATQAKTPCTLNVDGHVIEVEPMGFFSDGRSQRSMDLWTAVNNSAAVFKNEKLMTNVPARIADIYIVLQTKFWDGRSTEQDATAYDDFGHIAIRTTLSFCVERLQTSMANGTISTTVLSQDDGPHWSTGPMDLDVNLMSTGDNGWDQTSNGPFSAFVSYPGMVSLGIYFKSVFAPSNTTTQSGGDMAQFLVNDIWGTVSAPINLNASLINVARRFANITQRVSDSIRLNRVIPGGSQWSTTSTTWAWGDTVTGKAWDVEPYISVQFSWMILPVSIWLLVTINLIITICITHRTRTPIWKSSLLAALQCHRSQTGILTAHEMRKRAEGQHAQLIFAENSWSLRRDGDSLKEEQV